MYSITLFHCQGEGKQPEEGYSQYHLKKKKKNHTSNNED